MVFTKFDKNCSLSPSIRHLLTSHSVQNWRNYFWVVDFRALNTNLPKHWHFLMVWVLLGMFEVEIFVIFEFSPFFRGFWLRIAHIHSLWQQIIPQIKADVLRNIELITYCTSYGIFQKSYGPSKFENFENSQFFFIFLAQKVPVTIFQESNLFFFEYFQMRRKRQKYIERFYDHLGCLRDV